MPLQATSGAASYDAFGGGVPVVPKYIEEYFSTFLYSGTDVAKTITNGINLSTFGGLVWLKGRDTGASHNLVDSARGVNNVLFTDQAAVNSFNPTIVTALNTNGFNLGASGNINSDGSQYVSWTFRKQPKFFDVVTWTGTNSPSSRLISHNLGSQPGHIMIKRTDAVGNWSNWHINGSVYREFTPGINSTASLNSSPTATDVATSTSIDVWYTQQTSGIGDVNGATYVAYLFAHNAGGFGLSGTDNVISCGSFDGAANTEVTLGYEPQWIMFKNTTSTSNWQIIDNMRGMVVSSDDRQLLANSSNAEGDNNLVSPTATGFTWIPSAAGNTYIYIAIRRGPMRVPTSGTSVFSPVAYSGTGATRTITAGFPVDLAIPKSRGATGNGAEWYSRLIGANRTMMSSGTFAEFAIANELTSFASNTGVELGNSSTSGGTNASGSTYVDWNFRRAPSFFDEVCYTVSGFAANNVAHNLTVTPELFITKPRGSIGGWTVYGSILGATTNYMTLNDTQALQTSGSTAWGATSSTFSEPSTAKNGTYVCYLFATCAGVSKVFSFTGNGSSQTINCGFTGGARWVMIKRTDSTGDWYVWDSARGIVAGNDPHLSLNSTAAEVTTDDSVDTDNTGFIVNQVAATNVNVSSATYIGIAIA